MKEIFPIKKQTKPKVYKRSQTQHRDCVDKLDAKLPDYCSNISDSGLKESSLESDKDKSI